MRKRIAMMAIGICTAAGASIIVAQDEIQNVQAFLVGYEEVPAISTVASGQFNAQISEDETAVAWTLSYGNLEGEIQQSHIHFAQRSVNGAISVFLCSNLGNGPAGTQACPPPPATISGVFTAADVIGPNAQGIAPGELAELIRAIRAGQTYANVHSAKFPGGEARGQIGAPVVDGPGHHGKGNAFGRNK